MIKNKIHRMFAVVMALVVLLSSTGFGLVEHQCMMRGKTVQLAVLKTASTGCKACKPATVSKVRISSSLQFKKKACCEENQRHQKVEVVSSVSQNAAKTFKAKVGPAEVPQLISFLLHELELSQLDVPTPSFLSFSSRLYGRSMLSFVQSFLI